MIPTVAVIEHHREFAAALQEVVTLARCRPLAMMDFEELMELPSPPAAIVVRVAAGLPYNGTPTNVLQRLGGSRPKLLALASTAEDVAEAQRLGCDLVLRAPQQVRALYDALRDL